MTASTALKTQPERKSFPAQLDDYSPNIAQALPPHISLDKFKRVVLNAVNSNPDLLEANRHSLLNAAVKCAADGLMPDGREAALVIFNTKAKGGGFVKAVQYMPMVRGIIKLARQSGDIARIEAHIVTDKEIETGRFDYVLGDEERLTYRPILMGDAGKFALVFAQATFKDGGVQREFLTKADVDKVRKSSRSPDSGPWATWYEEMAKKTAIRRLCKYLNLTPDVQRVIEADDAMTNFDRLKAEAKTAAAQLGMAPALQVVRADDDGVIEAEAEEEQAAPADATAQGDSQQAEAAEADTTPGEDPDAVIAEWTAGEFWQQALAELNAATTEEAALKVINGARADLEVMKAPEVVLDEWKTVGLKARQAIAAAAKKKGK